MQVETFAPSPNWYLSSVISCAEDGAVAYGAKAQVAIVRHDKEDVRVIPSAHSEKVVAVSYGCGPNSKLLATVGFDNWVRIWDTDSLQPFLAHTEHASSTKILCVDWSRADPQLVVSIDSSGVLVSLDVASRTTRSFAIPRLHASTLACCPHASDLVAIGDNSGLVLVFTMKGGRVLHRMRGHDAVVVSLSWCPIAENVLTDDGPRDFLLASGAKASAVYIWRAGGDGRQQAVIELPVVPMASKKMTTNQHRSTLSAPPGTTNAGWWVATCWPRSDVLLTSSLWGETLAWDMSPSAVYTMHKPGSKKPNPHCHLFNAVHLRGLFNIVCTRPLTSDSAHTRKPIECNWRNKSSTVVTQDVKKSAFRVKKEKRKTKGIEDPEPETKGQEKSEPTVGEGDETTVDKVAVTGEEVSEENAIVDGKRESEENEHVEEASCVERNGSSENDGDLVENGATKLESHVEKCDKREDEGAGDSPAQENGNGNVEDGSRQPVPPEIASCRDDPLIWTSAQDRLLCASGLSGRHAPVTLPTIGGNIYCVDVSPLDSHRVALGAGDGTIRVWTVSPAGGGKRVTLLWNRISGRVISLAWHPTKETWLAYGTSDGRVGVYDTANPQKGPVFLWNQHRSSVYSLQWGPPTYKQGVQPPTETRLLYSCGDGAIMQFGTVPNFAPVKLTDIVTWAKKLAITDLAWKQDYSLLAVGNDDGSVIICRPPHLVTMLQLQAQKKMVQCLAWHPLTTALHPGGCPERHWLAVGAKSAEIKVFDLAPIFKGLNVIETSACVATLSGHKDRVTQMSWSPHVSGRLLSCSYDNTARVWDVHAKKQLAVFTEHRSWVYCCRWSPFDTDLAMTGAGDFTLRVWRVSEHPAGTSETKSMKSTKTPFPLASKLMEAGKTPAPAVPVATECAVATPISSGSERTRKWSYFPVSSEQRNRGKAHRLKGSLALLQAVQSRMSGAADGTPGEAAQHAASETSTPSPEGRTDAVANIAESTRGQVEEKEDRIGEGDLSYLAFFADPEAMVNMLQQEVALLHSNHHNHLADQLSLWHTNNFAELLEKAKAEKRLTAWHLAWAPMVSLRVWRDTCAAYAAQLAERDRLTNAVDPLLASRQPREAIELLASAHLYREAMVIAHCQIFDGGETARTLTRRWAEYSDGVGNYELAVDCYISLGDYQNAARLQGCRNDSGSLQFAARLASLATSGDGLEASLATSGDGLEASLAQQCIQACICEENWDRVDEVLHAHKNLEAWSWVIAFHRELLEVTAVSASIFNDRVWSWLGAEEVGDGDPATPHVGRVAEACPPTTREQAEVTLRALEAKEPKTSAQLLTLVGARLAVAEMTECPEERRLAWTAALSDCHRYQLHRGGQLLLRVAVFLFPQGPRRLPPSLQAYCYAGLLSWLQANTWFGRSEGEEDSPGGLTDLADMLGATAPTVFCSENISHYKTLTQLEKLETCLAQALVNASVAAPKEVTPPEREDAPAVNGASTSDAVDATGTETDAEVTESSSGDASASSTNETVQPDPRLELVRRLQAEKEDFVGRKHSAPNPFLLYVQTRSALTDTDFPPAKELLSAVEGVWAEADSQATALLQKIENDSATP